MKRIPKAVRRGMFFEMAARLTLFALTQGTHLVPYKFHPSGLAINFAILDGGQLDFK